MIARPCPHCETGWRRADELAAPAAGPRLVPCPTCQGTGYVLSKAEGPGFHVQAGEGAASPTP